jgi:hypothetical protein
LHQAMLYDLYQMFQDFSDNQLKDYRVEQQKEQSIKKEKQDLINILECRLREGKSIYSNELQQILKTLKS